MKIRCSQCDNQERFLLPLWIRATFRFDDDGTLTILHTRPLESLEEKLVNQKIQPALKCAICKAPAVIDLTPDSSKQVEIQHRAAVEAL